MQIESALTLLLSAASFLKKPVQDAASLAVKDAYEAAKGCLRSKLGKHPEAVAALDSAAAKPESEGRKAVLIEESDAAGFTPDAELIQLLERLAGLLKNEGVVQQNVHVVQSGRGHKVQVAGRDIINTEKHVRKNAITPDERHLAPDQLALVKEVMNEVAARLAGEDGKPKYAAVHGMLQQRYGVTSYLLIPRDKADDAVSFLKQQRAINRSRLRSRNPVAYQNDFYKSIWAGMHELGWEKPQVYEYAAARLGLTKPPTSLKDLGSNQLKALSESIRGQVARLRASHRPQSGGGASQP